MRKTCKLSLIIIYIRKYCLATFSTDPTNQYVFLLHTVCTKGHMSFTPKENLREIVVVEEVVVFLVVFIVHLGLAQKS